MRRVSIAIFLLVGFQYAFSQADGTIRVYLRERGNLKTNTIDSLSRGWLKKFSVKFHKKSLDYELYFPKQMVYHGMVVMEYNDKKKLKGKYGMRKLVTATDTDTRSGASHASML